MKRLLLLLALAAALPSCSGASTAAGVVTAVDTTLRILKDARSILCTTKLDPFLGNPREGQPSYAAVAPDASPGAPSDAAVADAEGDAP